MRYQVLDLEPDTYRPHGAHAADRIWPESNCAADFWIEVLHALSLEPVAAMGFTLSATFDGEQWRMFKFEPEDLRQLFGIEVFEVNVWRELAVHVAEHIRLGRMATIDVDAWHLPDTAALTYRLAHQKTTIAAQMIDASRQCLGYFHNGGYYELSGGDFAQILQNSDTVPETLPPYVEAIDLSRLRYLDELDLRYVATDLAKEHLTRRSVLNPVREMRKRLEDDLGWLADAGLDSFHRYAFGSIRQCGANAELAAHYVSWLGREESVPGAVADEAADAFLSVAKGAKSLEFIVFRALRKKTVDLSGVMTNMERSWETAIETVAGHFDV